MHPTASPTCTAFLDGRRVAAGPGPAVAELVAALPPQDRARVLALDDATASPVELWSGDGPSEWPPARGRGRPKLGVAAREVTLLPRHWDWLATQSGGASAALRRLVEAARRDPATLRREARDVAHRALTTLAGDLDGYEGALRALSAGDDVRFAVAVQLWPADLRAYLLALAQPSWAAQTTDA
jgi:hypothetical protein